MWRTRATPGPAPQPDLGRTPRPPPHTAAAVGLGAAALWDWVCRQHAPREQVHGGLPPVFSLKPERAPRCHPHGAASLKPVILNSGYLTIGLEVDIRTTTLAGKTVTSWWFQVTAGDVLTQLPSGRLRTQRTLRPCPPLALSGRVRLLHISSAELLFRTNPGGQPARVTADM